MDMLSSHGYRLKWKGFCQPGMVVHICKSQLLHRQRKKDVKFQAKNKRAGDLVQEVKCLPSMHKYHTHIHKNACLPSY
jgi:hypothetical protein